MSLIVLVNVVLKSTVAVDSDWRFDNLCGSHLQSQSELYHVNLWYYTLVIDLIGQLRRDVIGRLSVKPWCYWLWRLVISNWCISTRLLSQLNSRLWLWRWLPHRLSKRQSLSTTTVLFRTSSPGKSNSTYFWNDSWVQTFHIIVTVQMFSQWGFICQQI